MKIFGKNMLPTIMCATLAVAACKKMESEPVVEETKTEQVQEGTKEKITNILSDAIETSGKEKEKMANAVSGALDQGGKEFEKTLKKVEETPVMVKIAQTKDAWMTIGSEETVESEKSKDIIISPDDEIPVATDLKVLPREDK